jgi:hypothetical protein
MTVAEDSGFAPPPFDAGAALQRLQRELRELGLTEREGVFERRSVAIARAAVDGATLSVALVRRPQRSGPEWLARTLKSSADVRDFVAECRRRLAGWSDRDD